MRWKWFASSHEENIKDPVGPASAYVERRGCYPVNDGWNQTTQILPTVQPLMTPGQEARSGRHRQIKR